MAEWLRPRFLATFNRLQLVVPFDRKCREDFLSKRQRVALLINAEAKISKTEFDMIAKLRRSFTRRRGSVGFGISVLTGRS